VISRLNLASDPFRNRALPWTVASVVSVVSLVGLLFILSEYRTVGAEAAAAEREVAAMRAQQKDLERQAQEVMQTIPDEQRQTLEAAHTLVSRKGFSWSQLFADLEESLPSSVRVSRINVREVAQVGDQTRADLDLTVVARAPSDVTGMITEMSRAGTFSAVPVSESFKDGRSDSGYEWVLRVGYVQRARRTARPDGGAEGASAPRARVRGNDSEAGGRD
jgi:Tfp pilus assembly protein PilN